MQRQARIKAPGAPDVILELAQKTERPVEEVRVVYEQQLNRLESFATVRTFVPLLAKRRALELLAPH